MEKLKNTECCKKCNRNITDKELEEIIRILSIAEYKLQKLAYKTVKETPVAGTTDVVEPLDNTEFIDRLSKQIAKNLTNRDIHEEHLRSFLN